MMVGHTCGGTLRDLRNRVKRNNPGTQLGGNNWSNRELAPITRSPARDRRPLPPRPRRS